MIEINLVPIALRKKESRGSGPTTFLDLPKEVFFGVTGAFVILLLIIHGSLIAMWATKISQHTLLQGNWQQMLPDKKNIDDIGKELKQLRSELISIKEITSKKTISWSEKLNKISDAIPKEVWLRKIFWNNKALIIEGSSAARQHNEIVIAGNFVSNLKKDKDFIKDFSSLELNSVNRGKKGTTEVVDFTITADVK